MYLKSLTLKGFKSFADKTTLNFKPGITSVVGPNGSGKSNISDAILWVLGERSAKNIRGDAMEDVIFSGTKTRKAAQMAEVCLTLDNTDGTLSLDYSEISITRRIYRSGENEYLLNGSNVRRMDIVNILHDSGLGSGMHSIISQGSLDSILTLDSMQLRGVIEETAGILKHKERKAKSIAKLERLQGNVDRIRDITNEVDRQLKPLLKKAKKAEKFIELKRVYKKLKLETSVDDIKKLERVMVENQQRIDDMFEQERLMAAELSEINHAINELTDKIKATTEAAENKNKLISRLRNANDKLESILLVLNNYINVINSSQANINVELGSNKAKFAADTQELKELLSQKQEIDKEYDQAKDEVLEIKRELASLMETRNEQISVEDNIAKSIEAIKLDIIHATDALDAKREGLSGTRAQIELLNARILDIDIQINDETSDLKERQARLQSLRVALEGLEKQDESAREMNVSLSQAKDEAEKMLMDARTKENELNNQIGAIEAIEATRRNGASEAENWFSKEFDEKSTPLHKCIKADPKVEKILEYVLRDALNSSLNTGNIDLSSVKNELTSENIDGKIDVVDEEIVLNKRYEYSTSAKSILDFVKVDGDIEAVKNYLSHIFVCDSLDECITCALKESGFAKFVTIDGDCVDTLGNVQINCLSEQKYSGILENERRLHELKSSLTQAKEQTSELTINLEKAGKSLKDAQASSLQIAEKLALAKGDVSIVEQEVEKANSRVEDCIASKNDLKAKLEEALKSLSLAEPEIEDLESHIAEKKKNQTELELKLSENSADSKGIVNRIDALNTKKSGIDVVFAKAEEKRSSIMQLIGIKEMSVKTSEDRIKALQSQLENNERDRGVYKGYAALLDKINSESLRFLERELESETDSNNVKGLYDELARLRNRSSEVQKEKDLLSTRSGEAKIDKAKYEIEHNTLKSIIEIDCNTSLEVALETIDVHDRQKLDTDKSEVKHELDRLGSVDLSAKREYDALYERYNFLSTQLSDITLATKSIKKIDALIDERMKEDFEQTFVAVKKHFESNFEILFPCGKGTIELMPENDENSADAGGILISANPAGKRIKKMSLMSGGERSLIALGFLFALYNTRNTPFYVLDEVEAALDDTNLRRLLKFVNDMHDMCQFIMITHQRRTMELSDVLFGVSMQGNGITQVISQSLESISPSLIE